MKLKLVSGVAVVLVGSLSILFGGDTSVADEQLGLSKVSVNADSGLVEKPYKYKGKSPGDKNKRIPRAYDNAPPMIPHDISDLPAITKDENVCTACHMPEVAKDVGAIPLPKTHLTNLRNMHDLKGELYQGRWNCTQCHAPQAELSPAVMNKFKGAYRKKIGGEYKTNLIKTLRDGVVEDTNGSFDLSKDLQEK